MQLLSLVAVIILNLVFVTGCLSSKGVEGESFSSSIQEIVLPPPPAPVDPGELGLGQKNLEFVADEMSLHLGDYITGESDPPYSFAVQSGSAFVNLDGEFVSQAGGDAVVEITDAIGRKNTLTVTTIVPTGRINGRLSTISSNFGGVETGDSVVYLGEAGQGDNARTIYYDEQGRMRLAGIGDPIVEYDVNSCEDPNSNLQDNPNCIRSFLGFRIESQRSNLIRNSGDFTRSSWTVDPAVTLSATTTSDTPIFGEFGRNRFVVPAAHFGQTFLSTLNVNVNGQTGRRSGLYTVSFYAKKQIANDVILNVVADPGSSDGVQDFTLTNTWERYSFSFAPIDINNRSLLFSLTSNATNSATIALFGIQIEASGNLNRYIQSGDSIGNRSRKLLIKQITPDTDNWFNREEGTFFLDAITDKAPIGFALAQGINIMGITSSVYEYISFGGFGGIEISTDIAKLGVAMVGENPILTGQVYSEEPEFINDGMEGMQAELSNSVIGSFGYNRERIRIAYSYSGDRVSLSLNGRLIARQYGVRLPLFTNEPIPRTNSQQVVVDVAQHTRLAIGGLDRGLFTQTFESYFRYFKYFDKQVSDETLEAITSLGN